MKKLIIVAGMILTVLLPVLGCAETSITTRAGKGSALTWAEMDANFINLQTVLDGYISSNDTAIAGKLSASGGTVSGSIVMGADIQMGSHKVTGLANGSDSTDAAAFGQVPRAYSSSPAMNGTASAGTSASYAKGDHIHPSDTTKLSLSGGTMTGRLSTKKLTIIPDFADTCNSSSGGAMNLVDDTPQGLYVCLRNLDGTYSWVKIATGSN